MQRKSRWFLYEKIDPSTNLRKKFKEKEVLCPGRRVARSFSFVASSQKKLATFCQPFFSPSFSLSEIAFACSSCSLPFLVRFLCSAVNVRWIVKFQHYIIVSLKGEFRFCTLNVDANDSSTVCKDCFYLHFICTNLI